MAWIGLIVGGVVLWAASAVVFVLGRNIWPGEMPEVVRLAVAPAAAAIVTLAQKIIAPEIGVVVRALGLTLVVAGLDALIVAPLVGRNGRFFRNALGFWFPTVAIFLVSLLIGAYRLT
jgi:hypothetical protein